MEISRLSHAAFLKIDRNYERAAEAINLLYVRDSDNGITRLKKGKNFFYTYNNRRVQKKEIILRIKKLVIPPAWTNVWICAVENGHIQATGFDVMKRKQYRYHPLWNTVRNQTKFHRLYEFGKSLPALRARVQKDMNDRELTQNKVLALVISLMEKTFIRVGSEGYEKLYGSYGLTTLKDNHVLVNKDLAAFSFKGKKGVYHNITLKNKKLSKLVQACKDIPGKELFQYYEADGSRRSIDSGMVNNYIKTAMDGDFTTKDFRTWAGSLCVLEAFKNTGIPQSSAEIKRNAVAALDEVSKKLGNTRTVCKKYYVHPGIMELYEQQKLGKFLAGKTSISINATSLSAEEEVLMKILFRFLK